MLRKIKENLILLIKFFFHISLGGFVYLLSALVPKKRNLWVFGAWEGKRFSDNSKYLFLYVHCNHPEINAVWLTKSKEVFTQLKKEGFNVAYAFSLGGIWNSCRAKFIVITHSLYSDVNPYVTARTKIINLFHATLPIKKMGFDYFKDLSLYKRSCFFLTQIFEPIKNSYSFSSSAEVAPIVIGAKGIPKERVIPTGLPRADFMLNKIPNYKKDDEETDKILSEKKYNKLIYFVPTFRNDKEFNLFKFNYDAKRLFDLLEKTDSLLIFRFHPYEAIKYSSYLTNNPRIIVDSTEDVYALLKLADILVTDYSSICYDFIIFNRPIIFANFDHEGYLKERQLYHDYNSTVPGSKAKNWDELLVAMNKVTVGGNDDFESQRLRMLDFVHDYKDGRSCERIVNFVQELK